MTSLKVYKGKNEHEDIIGIKIVDPGRSILLHDDRAKSQRPNGINCYGLAYTYGVYKQLLISAYNDWLFFYLLYC